MKYISEPECLYALLKDQQRPYLLLGDLPSNKVYIQFEGKLDGKSVVWNACIRTIEEYALSHEVSEDPKQFIDITIDHGVYKLEIGLNIKLIDAATIERTIIMIRNYKRLQPGRHEYGARSKTE